MTGLNLNDPVEYKRLSWSELHRKKDDHDIRQEHRSYAEAEIARRKIKYSIIAAAIAAAIAVTIPFITDYVKVTSLAKTGIDSNQT